MDGKPVSTASTIRTGDTASLEFVSTLQEYRRRKAAISLCSQALWELFENGVRAVTLSGSEEAVELYRKLGSMTVSITSSCSMISLYKKTPEQQ